MLSMANSTLLALILSSFPVQAAQQAAPATDLIYQQGTAVVSLSEALKNIKPGQALVVGEVHGQAEIAQQHLQILQALRHMGLRVSVGFEFFDYPAQSLVEAWREGSLPEADFLSQIGWAQGFSFDHYRSQALFPRRVEEFTLALNAPRTLTAKISKVGLEGLADSEKALLPPQFTLGNAAYFERFRQVMAGEHAPSPEALNRYFAAQSAWDDTMAWKASEFLQAHPEQVLVIIVGEFHV
ncbi:MAG: ChaN family lipoprotein, partial [Pseudobdellovibrionaceae bacterium]